MRGDNMRKSNELYKLTTSEYFIMNNFVKNLMIILVIVLPASKASARDFEVFDCAQKKNEIIEAIKLFPLCEVDDDCRYFDYGYPFQHVACNKAIVSKSEENKTIKYLTAIEEYNQNCVYKNKQENKKFKKMDNSLKSTTCDNLPRLFCLKGVCRNQYYPLIFDNVDSLR